VGKARRAIGLLQIPSRGLQPSGFLRIAALEEYLLS
jgi:hypothetical protein